MVQLQPLHHANVRPAAIRQARAPHAREGVRLKINAQVEFLRDFPVSLKAVKMESEQWKILDLRAVQMEKVLPLILVLHTVGVLAAIQPWDAPQEITGF